MFFPTLTSILAHISLFAIVTRPVCCERSQSSISILAPKITELKMNLHRMLEGSRIRKKRQLFDNGFSSNQMRVGSAAAEYLPYLSNYNLTFWIPVRHSENQLLIGTEQGHLVLYQLSDYDDKVANVVALSLEKEVALKAKAFSYYDEQWFVILHKEAGRMRLRMYMRFGRTLEGRQSIDLEGESDFDLVTIRGVHYLAVVTYQTSINQGFSHQVEVVLYEWKGTQFDDIASRTAYGSRSVACWVLDGSLYMAVAQEINDDGNYRVGSPIYLYNSKEENRLVLREVLSTYAPKKVLHFYVSGNSYIIFIGREDAVIFWWTNDQFLPWQTIPETAGASDASILSLPNGEVAIVIARVEEVLFLTLDSSGHYFVSWVLQFPDSTLSSLQIMFSNKAYYALVHFATTMKYYPSIWKLTLDAFSLPSGSSLDALQECLNAVGEVLVERQTELDAVSSDLDRIWLKTAGQNISTSVIVKGEILSPKESELTEILIVADRSPMPEFLSSRIAEDIQLAKGFLENTQKNLDSAVLKSTFQEIRGAKHFSDSLFIPSLNLESSGTDVTINGVQISKLDEYALKKTGNQTFFKEAVVTNIYSGNIGLDTLNGINTDDFLLLAGDHKVTGNLKFSDVRVANLASERLNYIPIDNFVTTKSDQQITGLKTMLMLRADVVNVHEQTNGEYLSEIHPKIVTLDGDNDINGRVELTSTMHVMGVIFLTGLINGAIDIAELARESVTKNTAQDLKGPFVFTVPQFIQDDMNIAGTINGIHLDQLMTLSSNQVVHGDIAFSWPLKLHRDLVVDQINGIKLNEDVVLIMEENQFVGGTKVFANDLHADFIDMTEFVTLDGVDPSLLVQDIVKHEQGVVKHNSTVFFNAIVLGNVSASDGINGRNVSDLASIAWRKSVEQVIDTNFHMRQMTCKKDLEPNFVNGLHLNTDVVKSYGEKTINSMKNFSSLVSIMQNFNIKNGVLINGQDIVSFKRVVGDYTHQNTIHGTKILESLQVNGHLLADNLNGWNLPAELMKPNTPQTVAGPVTFLSELTVVSDNLKANTVSFHTLNSWDLKDFLSHAVTKVGSNFWLLKNKIFANLKANHLILHDSTLNSISLLDMVKRVVTLNTPQLVSSQKAFLSSVHLEKSSTAKDINGIEISSHSANVVLKDKATSIPSHKEFKRSFLVNDLFVGGYVNGIKIEEMNKNVFSRSEDNEIDSLFFFMDDIDVGNFVTGSLLDDVNWNDLIFLNQDEVLGPAWFLSDIHVSSDIFITGLLNGCDITELGRRALYARKPNQVFTEELKIESVEIIGNVRIANIINGVSIENLWERMITLSGEQTMVSDVHIDSPFAVTNLYISELNFVNLSHIIQDAVMKSIPQEINGHKQFSSPLTTDVIVAGNVFLEKLNGINIEELERMAVWKTGHQVIEGEKIFPSIFVQVATFNEYLNGLVLPRDVVKTDTAEIIASPVFFIADLILNSDLVGYSKIDGVNIAGLQHNRVTLSGKQSISSHLLFQQNVVVYEDVSVDGTINEVVLELAVKTKQQSTPLEDYKIFIEDLAVSGSMIASLVNGYDINDLEYNTLRKNKEEFISNLQVFEKHLHADDSLITEWINSISISKLTATFWTIMHSLKSSLSYFTALSHSVQQLLSFQMEKAANQASRFAYFVLIQEIGLGSINKILHGYRFEHASSKFSHSVVIWTSQMHCEYPGKCCQADLSYWGKVRKSGEIILGDAAPGKFYPIHNSAPVTLDKDFFIWTNTTDVQPKWCEKKQDEKMFVASSTELNSFDILMHIRNAPLLSEIKSFRSGHLYAVAGFYYDKRDNEYSSAVVYAFNERLREWSEHQILPSYGILSLDVTKCIYANSQEILLAVGTGMGTYSSIYKWNEVERQFELLQNIHSGYVTSTIWLQRESIQMLAMSEVDEWPRKETNCLELARGGQINIYVYENSLIWIQSIPLSGVISMASFSLEDETFLVAASSQQQTVSIFQWKGYAKFSLIQSIFAGEVRHLNMYNIHNELFLTVASASGPSKVLKVQIQGKYEKSTSLKYKISSEMDELKDEAITGC